MMAIQTAIDSEMAVNLAPDGWVQWVTGLNDVTVKDYIRVPCRWINSDRDLFLQVKSHRRGEFIVFNRWELNCDRDVPRQITASAVMAGEKYRLPVYPVLVNILRPARGTVINCSFQSNCLDLQVRLDCKVINLWDVDAQLAFSPSLAALLPFVPVMLGGNNQSAVKRAAIALEAEKEAGELKKLLAIFATCTLGVELVEKIMTLQTDALRASPIAASLKQQGQQEGALEMLKVLIEFRFGKVSESLNVILPSLSVGELQELAKRLLEAKTLNEFLARTFQAMNQDC